MLHEVLKQASSGFEFKDVFHLGWLSTNAGVARIESIARRGRGIDGFTYLFDVYLQERELNNLDWMFNSFRAANH